MGSLNPPPELTLDFKPTFIPKTITQFLQQLSRIATVSDKILKLDDFLIRLESEMRKIDAFKRELPLCMLLINDAIDALKEELMGFKKSSNGEPVLEEFIPMKKTCGEDEDEEEVETMVKEKGGGDKKNWLSSTQLWSANDVDPNSDQIPNQKQDSTDQTTKKRSVGEDDVMINDSNQQFRNRDRAFIPFKGCYGFTMVGAIREKDREDLTVPGLSLISPGIKSSMRGNILCNKTGPNGKLVPSSPNDQSNLRTGATQGQQTSRKQRRCWSTELHRRFVNALQQLGGSQAATPKQIRELMQVDGLTNDEVKSHLQKYRLHTRRLPSSNTLSGNQSGGVFGDGLGMPPQDQYVESSKHGISQSGSPDGPLLIGTTTGGTSTTGGDSMDGEESKSENYCWKGV
ncbi:hypothetical protein L1987_49313 [Smallanthus sonchifolius]|uniref:Uncharacterized protein n=1 Tax=Smallanthus sonchifolius TaxID=185202 RepID=A0ACB9FVA2_9ASTR|nr:hypothetical protein L1987_49313 [Smallanthus sonchifolius]